MIIKQLGMKNQKAEYMYRGLLYLVWISRISTHGVLLTHIRNQKTLFSLLGIALPDGNDCVLPNRHRQHRIALIVNVFPNQVHSPCSNSPRVYSTQIHTCVHMYLPIYEREWRWAPEDRMNLSGEYINYECVKKKYHIILII